MNKEVLDDMIEKVNTLMQANTCCAEAKSAAQNWLNAVGTSQEAEVTARLLSELEEDIVTVDQLLALAQSEQGKQYFGAEVAAGIANHAKELKQQGVPYCDCPACSAVEAILKIKDQLL